MTQMTPKDLHACPACDPDLPTPLSTGLLMRPPGPLSGAVCGVRSGQVAEPLFVSISRVIIIITCTS